MGRLDLEVEHLLGVNGRNAHFSSFTEMFVQDVFWFYPSF